MTPSDFLFVIAMGIITTVLGYQFGLGNQTEHLPMVLRLLDDSYLVNDFFVESTSGFGPRYYYVRLLAVLSQFAPLPVVVLSLALATNIALITVTTLAARDLLGANKFASYTAAILVVSVSSVPLGLVTDIRFVDYQPASLAIPFSLAAVWAGLRGKALLAALLAGVAILPHPLYGVETGAVAVGTAFFARLLYDPRASAQNRLTYALVPTMMATSILAASAFVFWALPQIGNSQPSLATNEIIAILAYFRAPHHYIPSQFPVEHYVALLAFLAVFATCWHKWRRATVYNGWPAVFLIPPAFVILGCVIGFVLIEVWPTRIGMIAQPFRMLFVVKWLGLIFMGWMFARWLTGPAQSAFKGWIAVLATGAAQPLIAFLALLTESVERRLVSPWPRFLGLAALATVASMIYLRAANVQETILVLLGIVIALTISRNFSHRFMRVLPIVITTLLVASIVANRSFQLVDWRLVRPVATWSDHQGDDADIARWAKQYSEETSIFVIPPDLGTFRLLARRPVVVDFEALPFDDIAMKEWRNRILASYGAVSSGGFNARDDLDANYRQISDQSLQRLSVEYEAAYAVLYTETEVNASALYANATYKIISLRRNP